MEGYIEPEELFPSYEKFSYYDYNENGELVQFSATHDEITASALRSLLPVQTYPNENLNDVKNLLIKGDDLLVLLNPEMKKFQNKIKFAYLDEFAMGKYSDLVSIKEFLKPKLKAIKDFLREDGSIWINCPDSASHHVRALCDEVFGEFNYITTITWERSKSRPNVGNIFSTTSEFFIVYSKNVEKCRFNNLEITEEIKSRYSNFDNDPRGPWKSMPITQHWPDSRPLRNHIFPILSPLKKEFYPGEKKIWRYSQEKIIELLADNRIWFGKDNESYPLLKMYLSEHGGLPPKNLWSSEEVGDYIEATREAKVFSEEIVYGAKPERLIQWILTIATTERDMILTCSAGNGSLLAVAHKMNRNWIGIERNDATDTHITPRIEKVISGQDANGITDNVSWQGGGSFQYFKLDKQSEKLQNPIETEKQGNVLNRVFEPTDIDISVEYLNMSNIVKRLERGLLNIDTEFQRRKGLWTEEKMSLFIESILLRLPLPVFYFASIDSENPQWEIIDGLQRISSIQRFFVDKENPLRLTGLKILNQYNDKTYSEILLINKTLDIFIEEIKIMAYLVTHRTPKNVKYHIFHRINTGGIPLEDQEIRHALYQGVASKFIKSLVNAEEKDLSELSEVEKQSKLQATNIFQEATAYSISSERMIDREFVNRFIAFYWFGYELYGSNEYGTDIDSFLNSAMAALNRELPKKLENKNIQKTDLVTIEKKFIQSMELAFKVFGNDSFRKRYNRNERRKPINKALFETISVGFAKLNPEEVESLVKRKKLFREKFIELMNTSEFDNSISSGTGDKSRVTTRHEKFQKLLKDFLVV